MTNQQAAVLILFCAHRPRNHGGEADAERQNDRVNQVDWVLGDGNRGGCIGAQRADHSGIHRLNQRNQNLFQKDRPSQHHNDGDWIAVWVCDRNDTMLFHKTLLKLT